ncbi:MAG: YfhO family protein [Massiliimalia sp.]|jgi:uncharacterized membrane protein YfhO
MANRLFHLRKPLTKNGYLFIFLLSLLLGIIIFLPFVIYDKGYFLYYGDFNAQQIPFYHLAQKAVKNGEFFWNWNTDLGANFIGSYSFYLLGSPFFWITTLFPNEIVPFLMAPLLILKTACAGVTGFAFLKRFTAGENAAVLGALLYAFSGFNTYNIFFNHFHEAVIVFPLLLVSLEELVINGRRGWFALAVALAAITNYFFFFGQVVFVVLYFIFRCFSPDFSISLKKVFLIGFESVVGLLLSCFLLLPALLAITGNDRVDNFYTGMNLLLYSNVQRYGLILESLFFPPDIPARPNFFPDSNAKWSSVSAYLPLFSVTGVAVFLRAKKEHWLRRLLILCGVMAVIPALNSAFYAFNSSYYARWFYMPILMMALATVLALEDVTLDFRFGIRLTAVFVGAFSLIGILPSQVKQEDGTSVTQWFQMPPYPERFWGYVIIAVISLLFLLLIFYLPRASKIMFRCSIFATCIITVVYSLMIIGTGKANAASNIYELMVTEGLQGKENFQLDQEGFYRVDESEALDNMPMLWDMPTIQCFHSIVPPSVMEFYQSIGVQRDVASRPDTDVYALRGLTSVKYLFCRTDEEQPYLPGFTSIGVQNNYQVYENQYFVPMGFTYDYYITRSQYDSYSEDQRDNLLMKAICLSDEDAKEYGELLEPLPEDSVVFTEESYLEDCLARAEESADSFTYDSKGFSATITLDQDNLVFFSVPYEEGWTAEVNGKPAEIITSNIGFMAVKADQGENQITFHYMTPGLKEGIIISCGAAGLLGLYLILIFMLRRKYPHRYRITRSAHRKDVPFGHNIKAQSAYLTYLSKTTEDTPHKKDSESSPQDTQK